MLHRALLAGVAAVTAPGWDRTAVEEMMVDMVADEPAASVEYAVVVDPSTLLAATEPTAGRELRLLVACRFGRACLIDNLGAVAG